MTMLPRLQAEEKLSDLNAGMLSSGFADKKDVSRAVANLTEIATGERPKAVKASPQMLAAMGIQTTIVAPASNDGEAAHGG